MFGIASGGGFMRSRKPRKTEESSLMESVVALVDRYPEGSAAIQKNRRNMLAQMARTLDSSGLSSAGDVECGHVSELTGQWESQGLSASTRKNRMVVLRWWLRKVGKGDLLS